MYHTQKNPNLSSLLRFGRTTKVSLLWSQEGNFAFKKQQVANGLSLPWLHLALGWCTKENGYAMQRKKEPLAFQAKNGAMRPLVSFVSVPLRTFHGHLKFPEMENCMRFARSLNWDCCAAYGMYVRGRLCFECKSFKKLKIVENDMHMSFLVIAKELVCFTSLLCPPIPREAWHSCCTGKGM